MLGQGPLNFRDGVRSTKKCKISVFLPNAFQTVHSVYYTSHVLSISEIFRSYWVNTGTIQQWRNLKGQYQRLPPNACGLSKCLHVSHFADSVAFKRF